MLVLNMFFAFVQHMKNCGEILLCRKKTKLLMETKKNENFFNVAMEIPIRVSQFFGAFPLDGIGGPTSKSLRFKWLHWRLIYPIASLMIFTAQFVLVCISTQKDGVSLVELNILIFTLDAAVALILFTRLAKYWPNYMKQWHQVEKSMRNYESTITINLKYRVLLVWSITLLISTIEHSLVHGYKLASVMQTQPDVFEALREFFVHRSFPKLFEVLEYSLGWGIFFQLSNLQKTFLWNFLDIFIMLIGVSLTYRLKIITKRLQILLKMKVPYIEVWRSLREDYVRVCQLCDSTNDCIDYIVLLSYFSSVYFTLVQIFSTFQNLSSGLERAYFSFSFVWLILRIICVCMFAGEVHEESNRITRCLLSVDSSIYNEEIERFILHMSTYKMYLTGKNFFCISRSLILSVASAIVTYELVLIQFSAYALANS